MINNKQDLTNPIDIFTEIVLAKKSEVMKADKKESVQTDKCVLKNILYVPDLSKTFVSFCYCRK